ncbi:MAG TPA: enoyl-CoA hydratase/isomerase family protein [Mycobacteriales bacterium]|nr:enoyl-CoA hydratase/isomerase family protein [Mycobacteriales bacterium]
MTSAEPSATTGGVSLTLDRRLAVVTIDRPHARNAIGFATVDELGSAIDEVAGSDAAVLVIRGGGERAFVSGGDLKELATVRSFEQAQAMAGRVRDLLDRIAALPIPVIAALNGHALGGGAEVAVAADIRIAAEDVSIGFNQVTLAIMPAWGGAERLVQLVGRSRAMLALTTGALYDAATAHRIGLVDEVVPRAEFNAYWQALARRIADTAPGASGSIKAVVSAAAPAVHESTRTLAIDVFARLWAAQPHWDAVEAMEAKRRSRDR